jgi:hypothetical protein
MKTSQGHIIIFSHGFGVRQDARGLFTDIAAALSDAQPIFFDYNEIDETNNTTLVRPLSQQAEILKKVLAGAKVANPSATIDLICHSQGAIAAALATLTGIRKTILIAPPADMNFERMQKMFKDRPGTEINMHGISRLARRDGSFTLVPSEYWAERKEIQPIELYNKLATQTELIIIRAKQDEVLGETDFSEIRNTTIINLDGNHGFIGEARGPLLLTLKEHLR